MFLIQGCYFQNQQWLGTRMEPIEGMVAVIEKGLVWDMFAGIIRADPENPGVFIGGVIDHYGESTLSDIVITDSIELSFLKRYNQRRDEIRYSFKVKDGATWVGEYDGSEVGRGLSRCILTEVSESFNDPRPIMTLLKVDSPHVWNS